MLIQLLFLKANPVTAGKSIIRFTIRSELRGSVSKTKQQVHELRCRCCALGTGHLRLMLTSAMRVRETTAPASNPPPG